MKKNNWKEFAFKEASYNYMGDALKNNWARLHKGDCEDFPEAGKLQALIAANPSLRPVIPLTEAAAILQDGWRAYHRGDFIDAVTLGLKLGPLGHCLVNKASNIYATYLEEDGDRKLVLWRESAERAEKLAGLVPRLANAWYFGAQALGRYSQEISIAKALTQGLAGKIKAALDKAIALTPQHADAHIALGAYHAEIIAKVGGLVGGLTYGASKDDAVQHFERALELNPSSAIARIEYANGLAKLFGKSRLGQAVKLYQEAAQCQPADAMERLDVELARAELAD